MIRSRLLLLLVACSACTDGVPPPDDPACAAVTPGATWTSRDGAIITIVATNPSPPARFTNWWAVTVDDRDGAPMIDPQRLEVSAFMPEHGHGAPRVPEVTSEVDGLVIGPLELWMPGRWEIRFDLDAERIVVPICIAE
jgi:hypothetical protein